MARVIDGRKLACLESGFGQELLSLFSRDSLKAVQGDRRSSLGQSPGDG